MKIAIIGSTQYYRKMEEYAKKLRERGFEVRLPFFDFHNLTELETCEKNRENIEWADEVHIFWDRRSLGTIFDFGMAFALRKPIKIVYLEKKAFENLMRQYERKKIIQKLDETTNKVLNDPETMKYADEYQRRYGRLNGEDLKKTFNI